MTRIFLELSNIARPLVSPRYSMGGVGSILMLHRVAQSPPTGFCPNGGLTVTTDFLDQLLGQLKKSDFDFVDLDEAAKRIATVGKTKQRPFIVITLDDGYRDNLENAVPLFQKHQTPYTIFVAPGLVDGRATLWWEDLEHILAGRDNIHIDFPDGRREFILESDKQKSRAFDEIHDYFFAHISEHDRLKIMKDLCWLYGFDAEAHRANSIMNWDEISTLVKDPHCHIGAHTIHHFAIARLKEEEARFEMEESARLIELETGAKPRHFAFPYGFRAAAAKRDFELARKAGFKIAVTTRHGVCFNEHKDHLHALPRISLNGNFQKPRYVKAMLSGLTTRLNNSGAKLNID